jgi:hypothetical protein
MLGELWQFCWVLVLRAELLSPVTDTTELGSGVDSRAVAAATRCFCLKPWPLLPSATCRWARGMRLLLPLSCLPWPAGCQLQCCCSGAMQDQGAQLLWVIQTC